mmetsp:Transcript_43344/g.107073  ORF Transcript_43344/g.107073 Transcript_43344/m.107073 type:complete len:258 (+) Transcript_43344:322-1095(+)
MVTTTVLLSRPASARVCASSVSFARGIGIAISKGRAAGVSVATCARSWPTVCVWLSLSTLRKPSAIRSWIEVVGAPVSSAASRGSTRVVLPAAASVRMERPSPWKGSTLAGGATWASVLLSIQCTSMSAPPELASSSRGTCPRLISARNCAFSGSSVLRSGPASTVNPSRQNVIVCACVAPAGAPSAAPSAAAAASPASAAARERPAPSESNAEPERSALYSSMERAPSSSRARRMNSRGSRICWPEPPPFWPCPPA